MFEKKKAEAEALLAHLEELVFASEAADAASVCFFNTEVPWATTLGERLEVERRTSGALERQRGQTQRLVQELHERVAEVFKRK